MLLLGLYILDPAVLPTIWSLEFLVGGMNDPFVYMHYCGSRYGCIWLAEGCESVCKGGSVCYGGVLPCVGEFDIVVCGGRFDGVCGNWFLYSFLTPLDGSLLVTSKPCKNTSQASPSSFESFFYISSPKTSI